MEMDRKLDEAVTYFQGQKGFHSLFLLFRKKYESLGRFGGSVDLRRFSDEEIEDIAAFVGQSPHHLRQKEKLKIPEFIDQLHNSRFAGVTLLELLQAFFGEEIESRKAARAKLEAEQMERLAWFKKRYPQIADWFAYLEGRSSDTHWIWRMLTEPEFAHDVEVLARAYRTLPDTIERYPIFSQRVAGNPHALDLNTGRGKLWVHLLHVMAGGQGAAPSQIEALNELLLNYNLLRDDIHNFVTQANLLAFIGEREHPVWRSAVEQRCVLNVPIRELLKIDRVTTAAHPSSEVLLNNKSELLSNRNSPAIPRDNVVFVVENSGVFSALLDEVPEVPLICTHGQFKLASLQLLDMLAASGYLLYYSGDFDPEGLAMALRLKKRYGEQVRLWRMSVEDYHATNPIAELGTREAKLTSLLDSEVGDVALTIKQKTKVGYQEGILHLLVGDLKCWLKLII